MDRSIAAIWIGLAMMLACCDSRAPKTPSPGMTREEVGQRLLGVVGLEIPEPADHVSGHEAAAFTSIFDCSFECPVGDLQESWKHAPKLVEKVPVDALVPAAELPTKVFDGSWPAAGGTQFVSVTLSKLDHERVRVEVRTTHEMK